MFEAYTHNNIKPITMDIINKGYIPLVQNGYNILAGEGGTGKSAIAIKSAIMFLLDNPSKNALCWMSEDGITECKSRVATICKNINKDSDEILKRIFWVTRDIDTNEKIATVGQISVDINKEYLTSIMEFCINNWVEFIVLDPMKRFHTLEENNNSQMDSLTRDVFAYMAKTIKATVLVLHHSSKGDGSQVRGAGGIANDARAAWVISKAIKKDNMTGKTVANKEFDGKIRLDLYKANSDLEKFCTIRDNNYMIQNPLVPTHQEVEYRQDYELPKFDTTGLPK